MIKHVVKKSNQWFLQNQQLCHRQILRRIDNMCVMVIQVVENKYWSSLFWNDIHSRWVHKPWHHWVEMGVSIHIRIPHYKWPYPMAYNYGLSSVKTGEKLRIPTEKLRILWKTVQSNNVGIVDGSDLLFSFFPSCQFQTWSEKQVLQLQFAFSGWCYGLNQKQKHRESICKVCLAGCWHFEI